MRDAVSMVLVGMLIAGCAGRERPAEQTAAADPAAARSVETPSPDPSPPGSAPAPTPQAPAATPPVEPNPKVAITGDQPSYRAIAADGWAVEVTLTPQAPAIGTLVLDAVAIPPGGRPITAGELALVAQAVETGSGTPLQITVTGPQPGRARVEIPLAAPGEFAVSIAIHRADGSRSEVTFTLSVP
ncbi:MAG TPA: hypothetical protein VEI97_20305 [bacterium]|nr:hypothetical protein [bacterium]